MLFWRRVCSVCVGRELVRQRMRFNFANLLYGNDNDSNDDSNDNDSS